MQKIPQYTFTVYSDNKHVNPMGQTPKEDGIASQ